MAAGLVLALTSRNKEHSMTGLDSSKTLTVVSSAFTDQLNVLQKKWGTLSMKYLRL